MSEQQPFMEKRAVVQVGVTPSVHSGKKSEDIKDGEAVTYEELEKIAAVKLVTEEN